jgi:hypothetical protein
LSGKVQRNLYPFRIGFCTAQSLQFYDRTERSRLGAIQLAFSSGSPTPAEIARNSSAWGLQLKQEIRESFGRWVGVAAITELLPSEQNRIRLDEGTRDYFGNTAPRIYLSIG